MAAVTLASAERSDASFAATSKLVFLARTPTASAVHPPGTRASSGRLSERTSRASAGGPGRVGGSSCARAGSAKRTTKLAATAAMRAMTVGAARTRHVCERHLPAVPPASLVVQTIASVRCTTGARDGGARGAWNCAARPCRARTLPPRRSRTAVAILRPSGRRLVSTARSRGLRPRCRRPCARSGSRGARLRRRDGAPRDPRGEPR